jgi:hypothetical protein
VATSKFRQGIGPSCRATTHHIFYLSGELLQAEGLRQKINIALAIETPPERVLGIARDENHLYIGTYLSHLPHKPGSVEAAASLHR